MREWESVPLGELCEVSAGGTPTRGNPDYFGGGIPWVKIGDMLPGRITHTEETISQAALDNSAAKLLPAGTVLISIFATIGRTAVLEIEAATNQAIAGLKPRNPKQLDSSYLRRFLDNFSNELERRARGVAQVNINSGILRSILVPLPPLSEQRRIAEVLDRAEALRAKRRAALAQLDRLAQAIFLDMFGDPGTNPKGWTESSIGKVCELIVDCVNRTAPVIDQETPFKMIRTSNVKDGKVDLASIKYVTEDTFHRWNRRAAPRRGDVLLTREAPVGETGIIDSDEAVFLGQRLMLYRADLRYMTPHYLLFSFRGAFLQQQFTRYGSGSTVKHLPLPACRSFQVHVPPVALQEEFTGRVEAVERMKAVQRASLAEMDALFTSLQHRAFRGEL
jgi:type I restriction enzyme, S subunit